MDEREIPSRVRAIFALGRLTPKLQSDVLADGEIVSRFGIPISHPLRLSEKITVSQEQLFAAFAEAAARGEPVSFGIIEAGVDIEGAVRIESDGTAVLTTPSRTWRFAYAGLLAPDPAQRLEILDTLLAQLTLSQGVRQAIRERVRQTPWTREDFLEVADLLGTSLEAFSETLNKKTQAPHLAESDLSPNSPHHWEHLTAAVEGSQTLREFLDHELLAERKSRLDADIVRGMRSIALTFAAPSLVPHELVGELDAESVLASVEDLLRQEDHFTLVGAFEICASRVAKDPRFVAPGERLLERLFGDTEQLLLRCELFAAAFVLATARLAREETTGHRPVYWRRLAAASHAGLVVRIRGITDVRREEVFRWAIRQRGREYLVSAAQDMALEPHWDPEWIESCYLAADAFGRVASALRCLSAESVPQSWQKRVAAARTGIEQEHLMAPSHFPAVLEGERRTYPLAISPDLEQLVADDYQRLADEPSARNLLSLAPHIYAFGVRPGLLEGVKKAVAQIRKSTNHLGDSETRAALALATHIVVLTQDVDLADLLGESYLDKVRLAAQPEFIAEAVQRLVQCTGADPNRENARKKLANQLEHLAFRAPVGAPAAEIAEILACLQDVEVELAPLLGRALHAARLAALAAVGG